MQPAFPALFLESSTARFSITSPITHFFQWAFGFNILRGGQQSLDIWEKINLGDRYENKQGAKSAQKQSVEQRKQKEASILKDISKGKMPMKPKHVLMKK